MKKWFFYEGNLNTKGLSFWEWPLEKELVFIGYGMLFILLGGYVALALFVPQQFGEVSCLTRLLFGLYCPMCGCSRAALYLYTGRIIESLQMNPVIFTASIFCVPFLILNTLCMITNGKVRAMRYHNIYAILILVVDLTDCIYKNWILLEKGIALIP